MLGSEKTRGIQWVDHCALGRGMRRRDEEVCMLASMSQPWECKNAQLARVAIKLLPSKNLINLFLFGNHEMVKGRQWSYIFGH